MRPGWSWRFLGYKEELCIKINKILNITCRRSKLRQIIDPSMNNEQFGMVSL